MRRTMIVLVSIFFIVILMSTNEVLKDNEEEEMEFREVVSDYIYKSSIENNCLSFVNNKLSGGQGGVFTNYLDTVEVIDQATGHQVLSESMGLIMLYHSRNNQKEGFDKHFDFLVRNMIMENNLVVWRYKDRGNLSTVSSTIDDLRIARALLYAYTRWEEDRYLELAKKIGNGIINSATYNNSLVDYYDSNEDATSMGISIPYLDIYTMELLSEIDTRWVAVLDSSERIIDNSFMGADFPFYKTKLDYDTRKYEEVTQFNMTEGLVTILHLAEVGKVKDETIDWIMEKLSKGESIYTYYNLDGSKGSDDKSTAIYALICRIGKQIDNAELYEMSFKKLDDFYVNDKSSEIYGAFGDKDDLEVYSFDNLQGLLAF